jgi:PPOX class probable F420-dependent enzyme
LNLGAVAIAEETPRKEGMMFSKATQRTLAPVRNPLTPEQLKEFLAEPRNAILSTINKDGSPQLTPVGFYWDGEAFYVTTIKETVKYQNLRRDPRLTLIVDQGDDYRTVIVKGQAQIQEDNIWPTISKILEKYFGRDAGATYLEAMKKQNRVLLVLKPQQLRTWARAAAE